MSTLVAVMPDESEIFGDVSLDRFNDVRQFARDAVYRAKLTTPRSAPQNVFIKVFQLEVKDGKLVRRLLRTVELTPPLTQMTPAEFRDAVDGYLKDVPPMFRDFIMGLAQERCNGLEESVTMIEEMSEKLIRCCRMYREQIKKERPGE